VRGPHYVVPAAVLKPEARACCLRREGLTALLPLDPTGFERVEEVRVDVERQFEVSGLTVMLRTARVIVTTPFSMAVRCTRPKERAGT